MGRYTGPVGKLSRREGINLFLKGSRSFSDKAAINRKPFPPGQHGNMRRRRLSQYGLQLREKQKVKRIYGLRERQFKNLFKKADRVSKKLDTDKGLEFLKLLEMRLDNVVYLLHLAPSRPAARQYVVHGHILVNGKKVDIPSYQVSVGDKITLKNEKLKPLEDFFPTPEWLAEDGKASGKVLNEPTREMIDPSIKEHLIIEFYSR